MHGQLVFVVALYLTRARVFCPEYDPSPKGPNYWRLTMADQPAKKQKTDVETLGISEMKALIKSAGLSSAD